MSLLFVCFAWLLSNESGVSPLCFRETAPYSEGFTN
jgi:hypothetical protein